MEIVTVIWQNYLYIPLFNLLVWLYLNYSSFNLGIAVIILTVILRILLLPFTVLTERGKLIGGKVRKEIIEIKKDHATDPVKQKILIRRLLKKKKIRPWAKAVTLSVQGLVLVLLYQVFLGGITLRPNCIFCTPAFLGQISSIPLFFGSISASKTC
jgi:YidC/Oxa1 family membrane protein insertase